MDKLNNDVILKLFDYVYPVSKKCALQLTAEENKEYNMMKTLSKPIYDIINKHCMINFIYKPLNDIHLSHLCECNKYYDPKENKINIINILNMFVVIIRVKQHMKFIKFLQECILFALY